MSLVLSALLAIIAIAWFLQTKKLNAIKQELNQVRHTAGDRETQLQQEIDQLSAFKPILDAQGYARDIRANADVEAARLLAEARLDAERLRTLADEEVRLSQSKADDIRYQAGVKARALQTQAESIVLNATKEANRIVSLANQRAEEIAGEALAATRNAATLEKTIQGLKNVINGYGDQYLIPSYSLLDELADEFGFTDAGAELKAARERTRRMMATRAAAICDYVEAVRKTSAENFVTDAFNGKVDTILSGVKQDNYGTLAQQIKDAHALVNNLGKPFKDARITPEYLQARLDELHWAVVAQELKRKEREEQRLIREQIREEEKARREYEKAQRDAAKQEEAIQKAIDRVQQQAAKASEEQRAVFELQLRELATKLQTAQEKNQRALSMAQQTKSGHVYIISNIGSFGDNVYKIGMTRRLEPLDRVRELGDASVPFEFDVHALLFSDDAPALERSLHRQFLNNQVNKVNPRKEFFRVELTNIKTEIERLGIETKWTLAAEARQYRESLSVEKALANNTLDRTEWEKFQLENEAPELEVDEQER